jgi:protein-disulfide isomerase
MSKVSSSFTWGIVVVIGAAGSLLGACSGPDASAPAQSPDAGGLVAAHSPIVGPVDAPVTIVEFFDPACEGCAAFHPIVKSVLDEFPADARLVYRYLAFHRGSDEAVGILEAARKQGMFETMVDALLSRQSEWASHGRENLEAAWGIAAAGGLDLASARAAATSAETKQVIEQDLAAAVTYRIQQTPTVFVNEEMLDSYDRETLRERVRDALAEAHNTQAGR